MTHIEIYIFLGINLALYVANLLMARSNRKNSKLNAEFALINSANAQFNAETARANLRGAKENLEEWKSVVARQQVIDEG